MPKIQRPHSIVVKVTAEERDAFTRLALKEKLTAANWLRSLGMGRVNTPAIIPEGVNAQAHIESESDTGNPITESKLEKMDRELDDPNLSMPVNGSIAHRFTEQTPTALKHNAQPAEQRIYDVVLKQRGRSAADAWLKARRKPKAEPSPELVIPQHLRAFYDSVLKNQGEGAAKLWIANNTGGVKLTP